MPSTEIPSRINVLAVDDKPANLLAIEAVLGAGYNVVRATSGAEAIALLKSGRDIDIILMDVQMPTMDGFEAVARIKQIESARDIPIVFITAVYTEDPSIRRGYQVGGIDYFTKPFDPEILRLKVTAYAAFKHRADYLKERERQLLESQELLAAGRRLSSLLESMPVGVIITDMEGRVSQTNAAVAGILKYTAPGESEAYGTILLRWWNDHRRGEGSLARALRDGQASHGELIRIKCFDGSEKTILCSVSPLRRLDGPIIGATVTVQDVSEPSRIEEDLRERIIRFTSSSISFGTTARR
jgi:PAS domain S-box-containing protein